MALPKAKPKTLRETVSAVDDEEHLWSIFWRGFFLPVRLVWRGLSWLFHRPPLKQIGHGIRWFFTRTPVRFIVKILGLRYLYRSFRELWSVTWPTFKESRRLTGAVIMFAVAFGIFVAVVDYGLDKLFKQFILK